MRKWRIALVVVLSCLPAACLELAVGVKLNADGSGQQTMHLGMSDQVVQSVRASARALDAGGRRADPLTVFDADAVRRELEDQGLTVSEHRTYRDANDRQIVDVTADFASFDKLQNSSLFGPGGEWFLLAGRTADGVRLVFYPRGHAAWLAAKERAIELRTQPTAIQQQFFATQQRRLAGLDVVLRVELPGDVAYCSTNMTEDDARHVTCRIKAGEIRNAADLVIALAPRFEVEFDGRGCKLELDSADPGVVAAPERGDKQ